MSRPVLIVFSVLTGLNVILGGAALAEVVSPEIVGIAALVNAGISTGLGYYVRGQVSPYGNVAALRQSDGRVVAGPAATAVLAGDANVGEPVKVEMKPATVGDV